MFANLSDCHDTVVIFFKIEKFEFMDFFQKIKIFISKI